MGFGMEILFVLMLGLLILGPKRLHTMLAQVARAKAQFEEASRGFKSQLAAELDPGRLLKNFASNRFWEGHDFSRAAKSSKIGRALAPSPTVMFVSEKSRAAAEVAVLRW